MESVKNPEIMERLWSGDAKMKYPKKWMVMVNVIMESGSKAIGDVYLITDSKEEAYDKAMSLGDSMGGRLVFQGFDDTPQIGGLWV